MSPFRKPLTQLNNRPACLDGENHVSSVEYHAHIVYVSTVKGD